jgi:hypothetical protein
MMFLKAVTLEGKTEYFNVEKILSIKPEGSAVKILMGAGLFWNAKRGSLEFVHPEQMLFNIKEGKQ